MHQLLHHHSLILRTVSLSSDSLATMSSSLAISVPLTLSRSSKTSNSSSLLGFKNEFRSFGAGNFGRSRVSMSASVGSQTVVNDALFSDYKPSLAFLFPGQVSCWNEYLFLVSWSIFVCAHIVLLAGFGCPFRTNVNMRVSLNFLFSMWIICLKYSIFRIFLIDNLVRNGLISNLPQRLEILYILNFEALDCQMCNYCFHNCCAKYERRNCNFEIVSAMGWLLFKAHSDNPSRSNSTLPFVTSWDLHL